MRDNQRDNRRDLRRDDHGDHQGVEPSNLWQDDWDAFTARLFRQREFVIKLGLEPMRQALELEGHPEASHQRILVAGTNGKGETAAFLSSILMAHGLRVGFFSSPHLIVFRERFRVDGKLISREALLPVGARILQKYGDPDTPGPALSFFELTTMMGAQLFSTSQVDVAVYEVGLGGRLDATNALSAHLSVVTGVGLDHTQYLGDTVEAIAREKAGIFRADQPAIIGRQAYPEAKEQLRALAPQNTQIFGEDFSVDSKGCIQFKVARGAETRSKPVTCEIAWRANMPRTRLWNAACAVAAAAQFLGAAFDEEKARQGLENSRWPGRLDLRTIQAPGESRRYTYLFDAAHNPDAARTLFDELGHPSRLKAENTDFRAKNIRFGEENAAFSGQKQQQSQNSALNLGGKKLCVGAVVCTSMRDKDFETIYADLPAGVPIFSALLDMERAASAEQLASALRTKNHAGTGPAAEMLASARRAIDELTESSADGLVEPVILVFGSIYLLGECFKGLGISADSLVSDVKALASPG